MKKKTAKDRARDKLLQYLGNPENEWLPRIKLSTEVLGYTTTTAIHNMFTADELCEIDNEALALRRKKYASRISEVDRGMLSKALVDPQAARLIYQRFEDWAPKQRLSAEFNGNVSLKVEYVNDWREHPESDNDKTTLPASRADSSQETGEEV